MKKDSFFSFMKFRLGNVLRRIGKGLRNAYTTEDFLIAPFFISFVTSLVFYALSATYSYFIYGVIPPWIAFIGCLARYSYLNMKNAYERYKRELKARDF